MSVQGRKQRALFSAPKTLRQFAFTEEKALPPLQSKWTLHQKMILALIVVSAASSCMTIGIYTRNTTWI